MKNRIRLAMILGLLACLLAAPVASAQGRGGRMGPPPHGGPGGPPNPLLGPVGRILPELELTEDQQSLIQGIVRGHLEGDMQAAVQAYSDARRALEMATWSADASEQELAAASQILNEAATQLAFARLQLAQELLGILTEEQRTTLRRKIQEGPQNPGGPGPVGGQGRPRQGR